MKKRQFDDLVQSIKQAGAIRRGEAKPSHVTHFAAAEVNGDPRGEIHARSFGDADSLVRFRDDSTPPASW